MNRPRVFASVEALRAAVGQDLGHSCWHTVSQEQIDKFADATGDRHWLHTDPERAARGPFGATIAHGLLTLSLVPCLAAEIFTIEGIRTGVNYGMDQVRFPAPVITGTRIRASLRLLEVRDQPPWTRITVACTIEIAGQSKPACVARAVAVVMPTPASGSHAPPAPASGGWP